MFGPVLLAVVGGLGLLGVSILGAIDSWSGKLTGPKTPQNSLLFAIVVVVVIGSITAASARDSTVSTIIAATTGVVFTQLFTAYTTAVALEATAKANAEKLEAVKVAAQEAASAGASIARKGLDVNVTVARNVADVAVGVGEVKDAVIDTAARADHKISKMEIVLDRTHTAVNSGLGKLLDKYEQATAKAALRLDATDEEKDEATRAMEAAKEHRAKQIIVDSPNVKGKDADA